MVTCQEQNTWHDKLTVNSKFEQILFQEFLEVMSRSSLLAVHQQYIPESWGFTEKGFLPVDDGPSQWYQREVFGAGSTYVLAGTPLLYKSLLIMFIFVLDFGC